MANQFLIKNTMADMRALSAAEITALTNGTYSGVQLLGYYQAGDTPDSIVYSLSNTTGLDDGGSLIVIGNIKLVHNFVDQIDISYFGAKKDLPVDNSGIINTCIDYLYAKGGGKVIISNTYHVAITYNGGLDPVDKYSNCIRAKSNVDIEINGHIKLLNSNLSDYSIISIFSQSNIKVFGRGRIQGDVRENVNTTGQSGMGIYILESEKIIVEGLEIYECFGDSIYVGGLENNNANTNTQITLTGLKIHSSRRQGITLTKCDGLLLSNNEIYNIGRIKGTMPMAGIDIEPNFGQTVMHVTIENNTIYGCAGVQIGMYALIDNSVINTIVLRNNSISSKGKVAEDPSQGLIHLAPLKTKLTAVIDNIVIEENKFETIQPFITSALNITNRSSNIHIAKNEFSGNGIGINIAEANGIKICNNIVHSLNTFIKSGGGISTGLSIYSNVAYNTAVFLWTVSAMYGEVYNNTLDNSEYKNEDSTFMRAYGCKYFGVYNNIAKYVSKEFALFSEGSNDNRIYNNIITNSSYKSLYSIFIHGTPSSFSFRDSVENNTFIFNDPSLSSVLVSFVYLSQNTRQGFVSQSNIYNDVLTVPEYLFDNNSGAYYYPRMRRSVAVNNIAMADGQNVAVANANDLNTAIALVNDLKAKYNQMVNLVNESKSKVNAKLDADRGSVQQAS
jgi:hypothetical protein